MDSDHFDTMLGAKYTDANYFTDHISKVSGSHSLSEICVLTALLLQRK